ncbi:hypothetical protein ACFLV0_00570 [Chloroflexota bacterium]
MHDTVNLEKRGIPAVALVHDRFEAVARNQAKILGLPSAGIISIPEPAPGEAPEALAPRIDRLWDDILGALVSASD